MPTIEDSADRAWFRTTGRAYRVRPAGLVERTLFRATCPKPVEHLHTVVRQADGAKVTIGTAEANAFADYADDELAAEFDADL